MDFLKSLLIYMGVLFTMGVENASLPDPATMPTATPVPVAQVTAAPGVVPIATPEAAATASAPTITPNTRYSTLRSGDKGTSVRKLQQRLIELGYLKKGQDDGSYGNQTSTAVRAFQRANGLTADGVAGKATLTHLYEDPDVVYSSTAVTPTPKPTATPKPGKQETDTEPTATPKPTATPVPVDPATMVASWYRTGATVLLNGKSVVLLQHEGTVVTERAPTVYMHDDRIIVSLNEMTKAVSDWELISSDGGSCSFRAAGYQVDIIAIRAVVGENDAYLAEVDGKAVEIEDGTVCYANGEWLVETSFLERTIGARSSWNQDENTLVMTVTDKTLAGSDD